MGSGGSHPELLVTSTTDFLAEENHHLMLRAMLAFSYSEARLAGCPLCLPLEKKGQPPAALPVLHNILISKYFAVAMNLCAVHPHQIGIFKQWDN
jgi:hypothetical protein